MGTAPRTPGGNGIKYREMAMIYTGYSYWGVWIINKDGILSRLPSPPAAGMVGEMLEITSSGITIYARAKKDGYFAVLEQSEPGVFRIGEKTYYSAGDTIITSVNNGTDYKTVACVAF